MEILVLGAVAGIVTWDYWKQKKRFDKVSNKLGSAEMEIFFKDMELKKANDRIKTLNWHKGNNIEQVIEDNAKLETNNRKLRKRIARLGKKRGRRCTKINLSVK